MKSIEEIKNQANRVDSYKGFKLGDFITAYLGGYHKLVAIERRFFTEHDVKCYSSGHDKQVGEEYSPVVYYIQIARAAGTQINGKTIHTCDMVYCNKATVVIDNRIEELQKEIEQLKQLKETLLSSSL